MNDTKQRHDRAMNSPSGRWALLLGMALVVVLVSLAHWPVLSAGALSFDDDQYLVNNRLVLSPSWAAAGRFMGEVLDPSTVEGYYQPLTMISLMLDCAMGGGPDDLRAFHRTSLTLHVLNVLLLLLLVYALFDQVWPAVILALLFGLHPLTVDPIAWVADRKTLLGTFFALWSMLLYVRFARPRGSTRLRSSSAAAAPPAGGSRWAYGLSLLAYGLAMLAKPTTVPLPAMLLVLDYWPLRRLSARVVWEKAPFFILGGVCALITLLSQARTAGVVGPEGSGLGRTFLLSCYLVVFYLGKMAWPAHLSSAYDTPEPLSLANPTILACVLAVAALLALARFSLRHGRALLAGGLFFLIALAPTLGLVKYTWTAASNKYVYLPAIALPLMLAGAWAALHKQPSRGFRAAGVGALALALLLAAGEVLGTRAYLRQWRDTLTLAENMLHRAPRSAAVRNHLGQVLAKQGRLDEAVAHFQEAIKSEGAFRDAKYNLGMALRLGGRPAEAAGYLRDALAVTPKDPQAHNELGLALQSLGKDDEALEHFRAAVQFNPDDPFLHYSLANALNTKGDRPAAIEQFQHALRLDPNYADAESDLGSVLSAEGKTDEAISHFRRALQINPNHADALSNLGSVLAGQRKLDEAMEHFRRALAANPQHARANYNLGLALEITGKPEEAVTRYRRALQVNADYVDALNHLGVILAKHGELDEAIEKFRRILAVNPQNAEARRNLELAIKLKGKRSGPATTTIAPAEVVKAASQP